MTYSQPQQSTTVSHKGTSIFQKHLQEDTEMSTHRAQPRTPQSTAASGSLQSEGATRRGCGLRFTSRFMAKRRKLKTSEPDWALGSPSTVASGAGGQPRFPEPSPVKLPGPLVLQHPEIADSGVQLPQVVSIPATPTFDEPSSPGPIRRGGNNLKRDHPRKRRFDSACSHRCDVVGECGIPQQNVGQFVQRDASVHSMGGITDSAQDCNAPKGIDSTLYSVDNFSMELEHCLAGISAPEVWWTASDDQPCVSTAINSSDIISQRTATDGNESTTAFEQPSRLPSVDFNRWSGPAQRFAQDQQSASRDGEHSSTEWRSSIQESPETLSVLRVSGDWDVSSLDLNDGARPAETFAQPICNGLCGPGVDASPCAPHGNFDDDEEPHFPYEGMQFLMPRIRPREARRAVYWVD